MLISEADYTDSRLVFYLMHAMWNETSSTGLEDEPGQIWKL